MLFNIILTGIKN